MCFGYLYILDLTGFSIKPFQLKWFCSRFNSFIVMVSNRFPRFFRKWFNIGTAVSLLFIPISIFILSKTVIDLVKSLITNSTGHQLLQPVVSIHRQYQLFKKKIQFCSFSCQESTYHLPILVIISCH